YDTQQSIMFIYALYEDEKSMSSEKISNVEHCLSEIKINDNPAILAKEKKDEQFTVIYVKERNRTNILFRYGNQFLKFYLNFQTVY
ncbi:MAG: hypothetical protein K2K06_09485, partial [Oscillospiraceae bacterium]|nr:hypothetical protein [Oscillospiraceae bacterium]